MLNLKICILNEVGTVLDGRHPNANPVVSFSDDSMMLVIYYFGATIFSHIDVYIAERIVESAKNLGRIWLVYTELQGDFT